MSVKLMSLVWQTALPLNQKSVLLALCDWANDDGSSVHPSIWAISERITCSERTAQRLMKELIADRWVAVVGNVFGGKPGTTRQYRINTKKLREVAAIDDAERQERRKNRKSPDMECDDFDPFAETGDNHDKETGVNLSGVTNEAETGDKSGMGGVTNQVETGDTGVTLSTIDPPYIHQGSVIGADAPKKAKAPSRATILPDDFWPNEAAEQMARDFGVSLPDQLAAFQDHHSAKGSTFKDWQAAFRTWLRNSQRFGQRASAMTPNRSGQQNTNKHAAAAAAIYEGVWDE